MGYGHYSDTAYKALSRKKSYSTKSRAEIFESRKLDPEMDPREVIVRESRDSVDHPVSVPIIVGLDVTGSMGFVPENIVKETLPELMGTMLKAGVADPQVLFMGLGDFVYDQAPLQVGQFESSAELLDRWLTKVYLEGGGGGNNKESYNLAYLFAARHTRTDAWTKRQQKGFIFTMGDEPCAENIPGDVICRLTSADEARTISTEEMIKEAQERYHVFHLHIEHNSWAKTPERQAGWRELLGANFITIEDYTQVSKTIAELVIYHLAENKKEERSIETML